MKKLKSILLIVSLIVLGIGLHIAYSPFSKKIAIPVSWADDDERDEEDEEDEEDEDEDEEEEEENEDEDEKVEYKTVSTKLPDTVVTTTSQIPRYDTDKDGMYDDEDPHPTINEFLIVKDDNQNGIDDRYEQ